MKVVLLQLNSLAKSLNNMAQLKKLLLIILHIYLHYTSLTAHDGLTYRP